MMPAVFFSKAVKAGVFFDDEQLRLPRISVALFGFTTARRCPAVDRRVLRET